MQLTFKSLQQVFGHIPADGLKIRELEEIWSLQSALHLVTPETRSDPSGIHTSRNTN